MVVMTAINLNSLHLRNSLVFLIVLLYGSAFSQFTIVDSIAVTGIDHITIDRLGNIYLGDQFGNVDKYNPEGEKQVRFSPVQKGKIGLLESWNPLKIFVFYPELQQYVFLDRFLVNANRFVLNDISSFVGLASMSLDNNIWIIDYSDFSLKKFNISYKQIEINRPFDLLLDPEKYEISHMREYQNLLFISDRKSGILVFDNMGNYLETIKETNIDYFNFNGDEIYFISNDNLFFKNLYTGAKRSIKIVENTDRVIIFNKYMYFLTKESVLIAQIQ
jgi:hypothetical protein